MVGGVSGGGTRAAGCRSAKCASIIGIHEACMPGLAERTREQGSRPTALDVGAGAGREDG